MDGKREWRQSRSVRRAKARGVEEKDWCVDSFQSKKDVGTRRWLEMLGTDAKKDPTHLYMERKRISGDRHVKASQVRNTIFRKRSSGEGEANTHKWRKLPSFRTNLRVLGACVAQVRHQHVKKKISKTACVLQFPHLNNGKKKTTCTSQRNELDYNEVIYEKCPEKNLAHSKC